MNILTVPLAYQAPGGEEVTITDDLKKVLLHHILKMTERDWSIPWAIPKCSKKMFKVLLPRLKHPEIEELFDAYEAHRQAFMEVGKKPTLPNPSNILLGYIYWNYSYDSLVDIDQTLYDSFFVIEPTLEELARFRRLKRGVLRRNEVNATVERDDLWEQYLKHLTSQGIPQNSREYIIKAIDYWGELTKNQGRGGLTGKPPSQDPNNIILTTPMNEYSQKSLRERFRWISKTKPEFHMDYLTKYPNTDLATYPGRMHYVEHWDKEQAELEVEKLRRKLYD